MTRFEFRQPTEEDAQSVADLINAYEAAFAEEIERVSRQDVVDYWAHQGEGQLVVENGALAGCVYLRRRGERYDGDGYVHPSAFGHGVGTALVEWTEARARELGSPTARLAIYRADERAACLLRGRGFERIRTFFRMVIDLDAEPPTAAWPNGFDLSPVSTGEEHDLYQVLEDSFADHWDHTRRTYEEWLVGRRLQPELCFLVRAGVDLAAAAQCKIDDAGVGWVEVLGTRREYRRHGLGEALLRHSFRELYARGARRVALGVDAENPTGATRLYERVGMRVSSAADVYTKTL